MSYEPEFKDALIPEHLTIKGEKYKVTDLLDKVGDFCYYQRTAKGFKVQKINHHQKKLDKKKHYENMVKMSIDELAALHPTKTHQQLTFMLKYAQRYLNENT